MSWRLDYSKNADKFLKKNPDEKDQIISAIKKIVPFLKGETVNIDIKKLSGNWEGFYRIRKGKTRIFLKIIRSESQIIVYKIDFRGDAYQK